MKPVLKHWQDPVNAVLGVGLVLAPWGLGFQSETAAMINSVVVGLGLLAFALAAIYLPRAWEQWSELVLGLWLIASPWALSFNEVSIAMTATVIAGIVIAALALWVLLTDRELRGLWRKDTAH